MAIFSRAKNSFIGMFFGIVLVPVSIGLHAWNEYRTIHRSRGLAEAEKLVVTLPTADELAPELHQQLVHLTGRAITDDVLRDRVFGVRENAIHLARRVDMYQWIEEEENDGEGTSYEYRRGWHDGRINSAGFHQSGYDNPPLGFPPLKVTAKQVLVGVYQLSDPLKDDIDHWETIAINQDAIWETLGSEKPGEFLIQENNLYWSREQTPEPDRPVIGDLRIRFEKVSPTPVSLVSMLTGNTFKPFTTSNGETVGRLYVGTYSAQDVIAKLRTENAVLAWILRTVGVIVCVIGFSLTLGPIKMLVSWIPVVGDLTGLALFFVGVLMALAVSMTTIAIAWIAVRPLLGLSLLAIAGLAIFGIFKLRQSAQAEPPVINAL